MENSNERVLELAKKLKALADQGEGGEKVNAQRMLQDLMLKHSISLADIEIEVKTTHWFKVRTDQRTIFIQTLYSVLKQSKIETWKSNRKKGCIGVELTAAQAIELYAKYEFYWRLYSKELNVFENAFIIKHKLFSGVNNGQSKELTPEERAELRRALRMSENLSDAQFQRQLKSA